VAYLSIDRELPHRIKRGPSCYRPTEASIELRNGKKLRKNAADVTLRGIIERPPFVKMWPSPNPIEIVVTLRQDGDDPDVIARLVESLRQGFGHYSDWTKLPAPNFFERVIRDYVSDFKLAAENEKDEDEDEDEDDGDAGPDDDC
jgi:hypothetical protein